MAAIVSFIDPETSARIDSLDLAVNEPDFVALLGSGPNGERLIVQSNNTNVLFVNENTVNVSIAKRSFLVQGMAPGTAVLEARLGNGGTVVASVRVTVAPLSAQTSGLAYFYHAATLQEAKDRFGEDIRAVMLPSYGSLSWWEYNDFGKGFYTHPYESRQLALLWAKKKARQAGTDWGILRVAVQQSDFDTIPGQNLYFAKKSSRPPNSPQLKGSQRANWLEFVEYNRHVNQGVQKEKDYDWTRVYSWMRGPMWSKHDSNLGADDIGIALPENFHQVNWGQDGLTLLNLPESKSKRFLITKDNEGDL